MSRVGKKVIQIPAGVTASIAGSTVSVKGPKGELSAIIPGRVTASLQGSELTFARDGEDNEARSNHGMIRALTANMVTGVSKGFSRRLEVQGVGYRAEVKGKLLVLNLGYSHPVEFAIPSDIQIQTDKDNKITVSGIDRARVGQVAADIRAFRKPDRYKGKGIRHEGEVILLKEGKSG